jgi:hypothetical protein
VVGEICRSRAMLASDRGAPTRLRSSSAKRRMAAQARERQYVVAHQAIKVHTGLFLIGV